MLVHTMEYMVFNFPRVCSEKAGRDLESPRDIVNAMGVLVA